VGEEEGGLGVCLGGGGATGFVGWGFGFRIRGGGLMGLRVGWVRGRDGLCRPWVVLIKVILVLRGRRALLLLLLLLLLL